jgi:hypothetical protein
MGGRVRYYLAGRMSGIDQSNFPAFYAAAADLRGRGMDIISPAELDDAETVQRAMANEAPKQSWGDFLARDVKIVADKVQGIIFLEEWYKSRGAKLEAFVGILCGHNFLLYRGPGSLLIPVSRQAVLHQIETYMRLYS